MQLLLVCFVPQPFPCECTPPTVIMMYLSIKESVSTIQVWTYQPGWPEYPWEIDTEDERKACSLFCRMMNWTYCLVHTRQTLYHWAKSPAHFLLLIWDSLANFPKMNLNQFCISYNCNVPASASSVAETTDLCHLAWLKTCSLRFPETRFSIYHGSQPC